MKGRRNMKTLLATVSIVTLCASFAGTPQAFGTTAGVIPVNFLVHDRGLEMDIYLEFLGGNILISHDMTQIGPVSVLPTGVVNLGSYEIAPSAFDINPAIEDAEAFVAKGMYALFESVFDLTSPYAGNSSLKAPFVMVGNSATQSETRFYTLWGKIIKAVAKLTKGTKAAKATTGTIVKAAPKINNPVLQFTHVIGMCDWPEEYCVLLKEIKLTDRAGNPHKFIVNTLNPNSKKEVAAKLKQLNFFR